MLIESSAICTELCISASLFFFFYSKKWARIHGDLQAINLLQFSPPPTSKTRVVSITKYLLFPFHHAAKYAHHNSFSVLSGIFLLQV